MTCVTQPPFFNCHFLSCQVALDRFDCSSTLTNTRKCSSTKHPSFVVLFLFCLSFLPEIVFCLIFVQVRLPKSVKSVQLSKFSVRNYQAGLKVLRTEGTRRSRCHVTMLSSQVCVKTKDEEIHCSEYLSVYFFSPNLERI